MYESKYNNIPRDYQERLNWLYDHLHLNINKATEIIQTKNKMLDTIRYSDEIFVVLYEEPEGTPRPRARYIKSITAAAKSNPGFIQIYSLTGKADRVFMERMIQDDDFTKLDGLLIYTACDVDYTAYSKTPSVFNAKDTYLAELGLIRPLSKPDFDNLSKKYSDMYNGNVWLDDSLVVDAHIHKYYSVLPRVEIKLRFLNMLYNKYQYLSMQKRMPERDDIEYFGKDRNDIK